MINKEDLENLICIHRKHFTDFGLPGEGTIVSIYYKYNSDTLQIFDYSIQFMVDGKPGINVAYQQSIVPDPLYSYLFKATYKELHDNVLTKIK
tara:strand:+ start:1183 stop:1461 length:279 start_codon:yes stop_codon:yes gene_type:complete